MGDPVEVALGKVDGRLWSGLSGCVAGIEPGRRHQVGGRLANRPVQARDPAARVGQGTDQVGGLAGGHLDGRPGCGQIDRYRAHGYHPSSSTNRQPAWTGDAQL
jgi:hypothetical protein